MKRLSNQELMEIDSAVSWTPRTIIHCTLDCAEVLTEIIEDANEGTKKFEARIKELKDQYDPYLQAMKHYDGRRQKTTEDDRRRRKTTEDDGRRRKTTEDDGRRRKKG